MIGTVFRTDDVPVEGRFDQWRELIGGTRPNDPVSAHAADFWAEGRVLGLGPVTVLSTGFLPTRYRCDRRRIRRCDPELYYFTLLLDGEVALDHAGRSTAFDAGSLHMVDSSQPFDLRPADERESRIVRGIGLDIPKRLLPLPARRARELLGRGLPAREGVGALLADLLRGLDRQAAVLRPADAPRVGTALLDLLTALSAQLLDAEETVTAEARRRVTAQRVRAFIRENLHDPGLTPPVIAAAHHISLSHLHRVFQEQSPDETVAARIRRLRLEGARRDLADPALRGTPVHAVAARWGFVRACDFTRAFRAAYGQTPREYRAEALHGSCTGSPDPGGS